MAESKSEYSNCYQLPTRRDWLSLDHNYLPLSHTGLQEKAATHLPFYRTALSLCEKHKCFTALSCEENKAKASSSPMPRNNHKNNKPNFTGQHFTGNPTIIYEPDIPAQEGTVLFKSQKLVLD
ncbi:Hypothetical predicted protein [Podarcis lilfordi]|uniref:Uncharacterized protein n=1 Tax=Podarcis lilfordi TaxID=74358 RepID=A0AA35KA78_9SAUR|nr:Hypothetical predicted protein [Podarcis lilfordi]